MIHNRLRIGIPYYFLEHGIIPELKPLVAFVSHHADNEKLKIQQYIGWEETKLDEIELAMRFVLQSIYKECLRGTSGVNDEAILLPIWSMWRTTYIRD